MDDTDAESCGRCAMTSAVDVASEPRDPFEGERIELEEQELRAASMPAVLAGRLKRRANELAFRIIHGQ